MKRVMALFILLNVLALGPICFADSNMAKIPALFDDMRQKAQLAYYSHETLKDLRFIRCYYLYRSNIPKDEMGKSLYIIEDGVLTDFPDIWLNQALNSVMDASQVINIDIVKSILNDSQNFLTENAAFYSTHSYDAELQYLRDGMQAWQSNIALYHNALDEYFALVSEYRKYYTYHYHVLGNRKLAQLDREYAGQKKDDTYTQKKDAIMNWMREQDHKSDAIAARIGNQGDVREKVEAAKSVKVSFKSLRDVFATKIGLIEQNEIYMKQSKRLKQIDKNGAEAKAIRAALPETVRVIEKMIAEEQQTYGENWKDRYRDPKTGELPGGYLKDKGLDALKVMYNRRKGKMAYAPGAMNQQQQQPPVEDKLFAFLKSCGDSPTAGTGECPGCKDKKDALSIQCEKAKQALVNEISQITQSLAENLEQLKRDNDRLFDLINTYLSTGTAIRLKSLKKEMPLAEKQRFDNQSEELRKLLDQYRIRKDNESAPSTSFSSAIKKSGITYSYHVTIDNQGYRNKRDPIYTDIHRVTMAMDRLFPEIVNKHADFLSELRHCPNKNTAEAQYKQMVKQNSAMRMALDEYSTQVIHFQEDCDYFITSLNRAAASEKASPPDPKATQAMLNNAVNELSTKGNASAKALRNELKKFEDLLEAYKTKTLPEIGSVCDGCSAKEK